MIISGHMYSGVPINEFLEELKTKWHRVVYYITKASLPVFSHYGAFFRIEQMIFSFAYGRAVPCCAFAFDITALIAFWLANSCKPHVSEDAVAVGIDKNILAFDVAMDLNKWNDSVKMNENRHV